MLINDKEDISKLQCRSLDFRELRDKLKLI